MEGDQMVELKPSVRERSLHRPQYERGEADQSASEAEFLGWQETYDGKATALFIVTALWHPLYGSTVSMDTLREHHIEVPPAPNREEQIGRLDDEE
jgi:hypothetical protein